MMCFWTLPVVVMGTASRATSLSGSLYLARPAAWR